MKDALAAAKGDLDPQMELISAAVRSERIPTKRTPVSIWGTLSGDLCEKGEAAFAYFKTSST